MNKNNLNQIFQHYIDNFSEINNKYSEYYKWQVCEEYPLLMDKALDSSDEVFADELWKVKKCSENIIDGYTLPFTGLVEYAKDEPSVVKDMFRNLYADDGGDIKIQMEKIADFFDKSSELLEKYFPGSYLYKQNSHSVSAYLFLYDPDHHYMYKATQSKQFADCVEFYDDWGTGNNIKLDKYYRMCDELVEEIKQCQPLLEVNEARFDGRIDVSGGKLHPDEEKHILAFDIIYCSTRHDLYDGISYSKLNVKEKKEFLTNKSKAEYLKEEYEKALEKKKALDKALAGFVDLISKNGKISHKVKGEGNVVSVNEQYLVAMFSGNQVKIGMPIGISKNIIYIDGNEFSKLKDESLELLKKADSINRSLEYSARALEPYEEYLE